MNCWIKCNKEAIFFGFKDLWNDFVYFSKAWRMIGIKWAMVLDQGTVGSLDCWEIFSILVLLVLFDFIPNLIQILSNYITNVLKFRAPWN